MGEGEVRKRRRKSRQCRESRQSLGEGPFDKRGKLTFRVPQRGKAEAPVLYTCPSKWCSVHMDWGWEGGGSRRS